MKRTSKQYATACIERYRELYGNTLDPAELRQAYTESLSFDGPVSVNELTRVLNTTNCDTLKFMFGVYVDPRDFPDVDERDYADKIGRLTIFVWPHCKDEKALDLRGCNDDGDEASPLNLGDCKP
jgi:hypothetical protein